MREAETIARGHAKRLRANLTKAEVILWRHLRRRAVEGLKFRRQHPIDPYIADFAAISAKLVVEIDGATHSTPEECAHDARRTAFLTAAGWRVLRVTNAEVYEYIDGVWRSIAAAAGR